MNDPNSPTHFPTFHWLFGWRMLRVLLFIVVCLVTVGALFYAEENVRGKRAWNTYARGQIAKGEKLTFGDFIPPTLPDAQNLAVCPLLKPVLDFRFITEGKTMRLVGGDQRWVDTNGLNRFRLLNRTKSVVDYHAQLSLKERRLRPEISKASELMGRLEKPAPTNGWIDLAGWQSFYRTGTNLDGIGQTNTPARDVLLALRHLEPDLAELAQEAAHRPLARWPVFYDTNAPWGILLPHLSGGKSIVSLLQLRSAARLAAGETEGAVADLHFGLRLGESFRDEPFIISHLVRNACDGLLLQPLKEGLARHQFSDAQLASLQQEFGAVDLLSGYQHCMRAERAWHGEWQRYVKENSRLDWKEIFGNNELGDPFNAAAMFVRLAPSGWVCQNQLALFRLFDEFRFRSWTRKPDASIPK